MEKKYWAFIKKTIRGPFLPKDIAGIPGFDRHTLVCLENQLGKWKEAAFEEDFRLYLEFQPVRDAAAAPAIPKAQEMENKAVKNILEKSINKNAHLENEVRKIRREYDLQKRNFQQTLEKKEMETKLLTEKVKHLSGKITLAMEHPSWENLYKELKRRTEGKLDELQKENSRKHEETNRLKNQIQNLINKYEEIKNSGNEKHAAELNAVRQENMELRNAIEEKELIISTMEENISSLISKSQEFQKILLEERKEYEAKSVNFCDEIGKLRSDVKWKDEELSDLRSELKETLSKLKEIESVDQIKTREQEELFNVIHHKIKILTDYFENLESRIRFNPKKAES
ncbi:MAG: hypothetical protein COT17_05915 [Elusimicrobia bacterium CG08_land_8_20_14_0_20_51_18]|nr:MAG: hypothetical protein COT17_05915 [Elusimicrobia bacterium CG08_land_8_20_14_0_20_51_18]